VPLQVIGGREQVEDCSVEELEHLEQPEAGAPAVFIRIGNPVVASTLEALSDRADGCGEVS